MSAFGGIVALNRECDAETAEQIIDSFKEVVVAPEYTDAALDVLFEKENLRVLSCDGEFEATEPLTESPSSAADSSRNATASTSPPTTWR